jgi:exonuclease SbcC
VGYDEAAHQQRRKEIRALQQYEGLKSELDHVLRTLPDVEARIARLDHQINEAEAHIAEDRARIETLNAEQDELAQHIAGLKEWEGYLSDLRDQQGRVQYRVGAAQQKLHSLEEQRRRREALILEQTALAEERSVYEELRTAFGKDGVPAMLIEASIPEIENEANELLSRMTDGRMHVRFDTQREKVTGGVKETLDILIADELGTRDYGTFSGGEAFRVNFAIRLALSKLLARRAGAQLRTLVIDEGFGTQDSSGRERLVQAINAIKDDFDLILVITHIEELKEAFPVRIEITKTGSGSQVEIV